MITGTASPTTLSATGSRPPGTPDRLAGAADYAALKRAQIPLAMPAATIRVRQDDAEHRAQAKRELDRRPKALAAVEFLKPCARRSSPPSPAAPLRPVPRRVHHEAGRGRHWPHHDEAGPRCGSFGAGGWSRIEAPALRRMGLMTGEPRTATVVALTGQCYRPGRRSTASCTSGRRSPRDIGPARRSAGGAHARGHGRGGQGCRDDERAGCRDDPALFGPEARTTGQRRLGLRDAERLVDHGAAQKVHEHEGWNTNGPPPPRRPGRAADALKARRAPPQREACRRRALSI
jgi:hypothetical protein